MWIQPETATAVGAHGEVVGPRSVLASPCALPSSTPEPVPAPVAALPAYVVHDGIRHVPIDVLPWERVTFRTICGQDVTADEDVSGEVAATCEWCRR